MSKTPVIDRVERLGDLAFELAECESVDDVYDHAVTASEDVIQFDAAIVCTVSDDTFEPRAVNVRRLIPGEPLSVTDGIAGKTVREGRTCVVDDVTVDPDAAPSSDAFRSVLSIPFDGDGLLQFHSTERAAFSTRERRLGELLAATVTNALGRVTYETALSRERDRFAALFENVPDAAVQYRVDDGERSIEAVNSAFVRVFGYDAADVVGESIESVIVHGDGRAEPELAAVVDGNRRTDVEVVRETASGPRPFLLRNVPVATGDDGVSGYLIYTDLTALKVRERELERKNERLDEFASIVSHDLRNPLTVANGYLELARERNPSRELDEIREAHERMEHLVEDVLALARDGDRVDDLEPVHLGTAAREAWTNVATDAATVDLDAESVVEADPRRLLQLFENLFRNAIEHAGPDVTVRVEGRPDGFVVEDDGPGIPSHEREAVFEAGYSSSADGTGLGLAIVRQISDAHGWSVVTTEGTDGGARFEFTDGSADRSGGSGRARRCREETE